MSEKAKKGKIVASRLKPAWFFLLWIFSAVATTYLGAGVFQWLMNFPALRNSVLAESWSIILVSSLIVGSIVALVKKLLLRLAFRHEFRGWIRASLLGIVLSIIPILIGFSYETRTAQLVTGALVAFLSALPLAWLLRRYVQASWLYVLAAVLGHSLTDLLFIYTLYRSDLVSLSFVGIREIFFALTMLWFFRTMYKTETLENQSQDRDHRRLEDGSNEETSSTDFIGTNLAQDAQAK